MSRAGRDSADTGYGTTADTAYGTTVTGQRPALTSRTATDPMIRWASGLGCPDHHGVRLELVGRGDQTVVRITAEGVELPAHGEYLLDPLGRGPDLGDQCLGDLPGGLPDRGPEDTPPESTGCTYTMASSAFCRRASPAAYAAARSDGCDPSIPTTITLGPSVPRSNW